MEERELLRKWVEESDNIVFFGGAGVSTESGVPDFRGQDGLYRQQYAYPPEEILSHSFFMEKPEEFYRFYRAKMLCKEAKPNWAHKALARLEERGKVRAVITQNIDGLHQMAGSKEVLELHGTVYQNHCIRCHKSYPLSAVTESEGVPRCSCGGIIKPDVVLYGENLDGECLRKAISYIRQAEVLIVGGTSLTVYPAAGLIDYYGGGRLVLINQSATAFDRQADLILTEPIGEVLKEWA